MRGKTPNERIIFGLKLKQLRTQKGLNFAELAKATGVSVSYLNEIEKGKKFPKPAKIAVLATALNTSSEELTSPELDAKLSPVSALLQSNFLNDLPLDLFGIELNKIAEIIANAPMQVGAFISTLLELSRNYAVYEENFYFAALRAYLELNNNYFKDIEEKVIAFCEKHEVPTERPLSPTVLEKLLGDLYQYRIDLEKLDQQKELKTIRSVFIPHKNELLVSSQLNENQKAFLFGKELGFQELALKERANTSSILKGKSFEEVLNHAFATYFSVALHIPLTGFVEEMKAFFEADQWNGEAFLSIMNKYNATPEMYYHRLTNIIPAFFNMPKLFFMRFTHNPSTKHFEVDRELHLNRRHQPHGNGLLEHYCRRWVSVSLLQDLADMQQEGKYVSTIVKAQRSRYFDTEDEYLCVTIARPSYPEPNKNVSVTLGLLINKDVKKQIKWLDDPAIQFKEVNTTCERCPIKDCKERAAEPAIITKKEKYRTIQERLKALSAED